MHLAGASVSYGHISSFKRSVFVLFKGIVLTIELSFMCFVSLWSFIFSISETTNLVLSESQILSIIILFSLLTTYVIGQKQKSIKQTPGI